MPAAAPRKATRVSTAPSTPLRRLGLLALVLAVVLSPLALLAAPAQAAGSTGLVISEVFGANAAAAAYNQDYVEVYNPTASAISLAGKSVQYRSATGTAASSKVDLPSILLPAGGHFLVGGASTTPTTAATITPDAANTGMNLSGTAGVVVLANSQTLLSLPAATDPSTFPAAVIDLVGYGTTATLYETSKAPAPTTSGTPPKPVLNRAGNGATDTDNNGTDFSTAATGTPQVCDCIAPTALKITEIYTEGGRTGAAYDHDYVEIQNTSGSTLTMTGLSLQYRAPGATGTATKLVDLTGSMAANTYDVVQLGTDGAAGAPVADVQYDLSSTGPNLDSAGGTLFVAKRTSDYDPGTGAVTADQFRADLVGWGSGNTFETAAADSSTVTPAKAITRLAGGTDTDDNSADLNVLDPTPNGAPAIPELTIAEIQGTGATTPMPNAIVETQGLVTASYGTGATDFKGFYLQTGGPETTPDASDAIFVFMGSKTSPAVGTSVSVTGRVSEFSGMTELTPSTAGDVTTLASALPAVVPGTRLPGTDCTAAAADCLTGAALAAEREKHEGELYQPTDPFTVTDGYDGSPWADSGSSNFGEIGLAANSTKPLYLSVDLVNPRDDLAAFNANEAFNEAHAITLSDAQSGTASTSAAFPWMTKDHTVRVGAAVTFPEPVVLDYRNSAWNLQPIHPVTAGDTGEGKVSIEQDRPAAPDDVLGTTGNVKIATFNMLNYFVHDAQSWASLPDDAAGHDRHCTYYTERSGSTAPGNRVTANTCSWTDTRGVVPPASPVVDGGLGPRGAAQKCNCADLSDPNADFERQQAKEILAINTMDADVMSLEEVENPIKLGYGGVTPTAADRDIAVAHLVDVLNQAWSAGHGGEDTVANPRWAFVPSPRPEAQPTIAEQDAIRSAFIYNPRKIETVGRSEILVNSAPFRNAREPLAQAFKRVGGNRDDGFVVIVNHLKSKSAPQDPTTVVGTDNDDAGKGAGYYNGDRVRQARALAAFADSVSQDKGIPAVFMTGDYNAYSHEDPVQTLEAAGWHNLEPQNGEASYSFAGLAGSLDHVFANDAAVGMVSGQTVWPINANEPVYYEYSRYNYDLTQFYDGTVPFRASDHNPEIIGVDAPVNPPLEDVDTVQVLASNDFHGRILDDPASAAAGAAAMAGAVKGLRADNPNTLFAMAGDLIGGSTFESFIAKDKPTIDAMNEAGLDVSSAGNHEFDKGYRDLIDRVMKPYDATDNKYGGANWPYLAANVRLKSDGSYALKSDRADHGYDHSDGATWWKTLDDGHTVGFIGAVTEDLPSLVAPSALEEVDVTPIVAEVNAAADRLKGPGGCGSDDGCDLVIELVHEGAATPALSSLTDGSKFAQIVNGANENVDAIVSGHTHLKYNHKLPVEAWATEDRAVTERPVVSAGQYGSYLNQLEFDFEPGTDNLLDVRQHVLAMKDYDPDSATQDIVADAVDNANVQGQVSLGSEDGPFQRARRQDPATSTVVENRGGESTLGNLVAEIQRWKTGAEIGFMNPGGLRADLMGSGSYPSDITYRQAADVQPFANTLMTADLTGAQIKTVLEQQWQRDPDGNVPSRPFLRLGTSKGFQFSYDPTRPEGDRITGMWLDGDPLDAATTYRVSATNFLFEGGDNFRGLIAGTHQQDTGFSDLQATVDYLAAHPTVSPDFGQHAVDVQVTSATPGGGYGTGDTVTLDVASLAMTGDQVQSDTQDTAVRVYDGSDPVGPAAAVDNTLRSLPDDEAGTAHVTFTVPAGVTGPTTTFLLEGDRTGTAFPISIPTRDNRTATTVSADDAAVTYGESGDLAITVAPAAATGTVTVKDGSTVLGTATLAGGEATYTLAAGSLEPGDHTLSLAYGGDATYAPSTSPVDVTVSKATPTVDAAASPATVAPGETSTVQVQVSATGSTPTGTVTCSAPGMTDVDATLSGGEASCEVGPWTTAGDRTVTVDYSGDGHTASGRTTETVSVARVAPTVSALANPTTVTQGTGTSDVSVTVSSAGATPTGTITCDDGTPADVVLASGATTCTVGPFATSGTKTVTLTYSGDANTEAGSTTVAIAVTAPGGGGSTPVDTTVSGQADPITWGNAGSVHVTVTSTKATTGTVTLSEGDSVLGSAGVATDGTADVVVPAKSLAAGSHVLTLRYSGDAKNNASTGPVTVEVIKTSSTTTVTVDPASVTVHQGKVTVTAQVSSPAGVPGGSVEFAADGLVVATVPVGTDGTATAQIGPFDTVRTHDVTARYTGDDSTTGSQASGSVTVTRATPKLTVDRSPDTVVQKETRVVLDVAVAAPGQVVTGDVKVTGAPGGTILATLSGGSVRIKLPVFTKNGKVTLEVTYLGSADNQKVSKEISFVVLKKG